MRFGQTIVAFGLLFAALLLFYLPALPARTMNLDDDALTQIPQLELKPNIKTFKTLFTPGTHADFYPVRDISYLADIHLFGGRPVVFRVHQMILLFATALVLFLILKKLNVPDRAAFFTVSLWIFHPVQSEIFLWISARKDALALFFGSLSVLIFLGGLERGKKRWFALCLGFFLLSLLSKASLGMLPLVGLWAAVIGFKKLRERKAIATLILGTVMGLGSSVFQSWFYTRVNDMTYPYGWSYRVQTSAAALGKMFGGWLNPSRNVIDVENWGQWLSLNRQFVPIGYLLWSLLIVGFFVTLVKKKRSWNLVFVAVAVVYAPISGLAFPHRLFFSTRYLDTVMAVFLTGWTAVSFQRKRPVPKPLQKYGVIAFQILFFLFAARADFQEGRLWADPLNVAMKGEAQDPQSISLKTSSLFEAKALLGHDDAEVKGLYEQKMAELENLCAPQTAGLQIWFSNCRRFYQMKWQESALQKSFKIAKIWLGAYEKTFPDQVRSRQVERYELEDSMLKGDLSLVRLARWKKAVEYYPESDYRIENWVASCYLNDAQTAGNLLRNYIQDKLLLPSDAGAFINKFATNEVRSRLLPCLPGEGLK